MSLIQYIEIISVIEFTFFHLFLLFNPFFIYLFTDLEYIPHVPLLFFLLKWIRPRSTEKLWKIFSPESFCIHCMVYFAENCKDNICRLSKWEEWKLLNFYFHVFFNILLHKIEDTFVCVIAWNKIPFSTSEIFLH